MARKLPDELGEALTVHEMDLNLLRRRASEYGVPLDEEYASVVESAKFATGLMRDYCMQLRSPVLDLLGVGPAIRAHTDLLAERGSIAFEIDVLEDKLEMGPEVEINIFRIAQEALTNVVRHSKAERVTVTFRREADGRVVLEVADDGVGIQPEGQRTGKSMGILGMHERAMAIGGSVTVGKADGGGTLVRLEVGPGSRH